MDHIYSCITHENSQTGSWRVSSTWLEGIWK